MRNILSAAIVLVLTASALSATVYITIVDEDNCWARIDYNSPDANVSAFALDITVSAGTINDINDDYFSGECTSSNKGYGIFPANFRDYIDPNDPNWDDPQYTPLADPCDRGSLGGLDTNGVTIEMGALYEDGNQPARSGTLVSLHVSQGCNMSAVVNEIRSGVVLEDSNLADVNVAGATAVSIDCGPGPNCVFSPSTDPCSAKWFPLVGQPACWCEPRQCHGDADNRYEGKDNRWVLTNDLAVLIAAWNKTFTWDANIAVGTPSKKVPYICADFDHAPEGKQGFRVLTVDLGILIANWNQAYHPDPNCPGAP
jgi:hypothetical protein